MNTLLSLFLLTLMSNAHTMHPLANEFSTVYSSPNPGEVYAGSPGIVRLGSGRLVATLDTWSTRGNAFSGIRFFREFGNTWFQGRIYTSDDEGKTWQHRTDYPFLHARPFIAGQSVYVLGQANDLMIIRSDDGGESWSSPSQITEGQFWHQAPCNVHYANGCIYLVMERRVSFDVRGWYVAEIAPVLMRGRTADDLTLSQNWTFASELSFQQVLTASKIKTLDYFGLPFFKENTMVAPGRNMEPMGWLEFNVVQFTDPAHLWHDPDGLTFHLWGRAHTGGTGYAAIAKVVEQGTEPGTGAMITQLETVPSGKTILFTPVPGGQMKFHVIHDEVSQLYWLLSTQATDSMRRIDQMPANRYSLPNNERRRLQLHFSRNMVDWCFAGLVAAGPVENASRHYASMAIDGDDLIVLSRSGDNRSKNPHDTNMITFHRIPDFRSLAY